MQVLKFHLVILTALLLFPLQTQAALPNGEWTKLGEREVNLDLDRDVISCSGKGPFSAIRFHVEKTPVSFEKVYVKYGNGSVDNLNFNEYVRQGANSPELDLRGNKRIIKEIIVYYKAEKKSSNGNGNGNGKGGKGKTAKVQIWGRN